MDNLNVAVKDIYKVDLLTAIRWFKKAWIELPSSAIHNCWRHTMLLNSCTEDVLTTHNVVENDVQGELQQSMAELVTAIQRLSISE